MRNAVMEMIILTAAYYGKDISEEVLRMYADDLSDLPPSEVLKAYQDYRRNPRNLHAPLPAQIRAIVRPTADPEGQAREIAARIEGAIVKFGWCNSGDAEKFVGPVGWEIVQRQGGWSHLCENHGRSIDPSVFQAQVREQAKALINDQKLNTGIQLSEGLASRLEALTGVTLK